MNKEREKEFSKRFRVLVNYYVYGFDTLEQATNCYNEKLPKLELGFHCGQVTDGVLMLVDMQENKMLKQYTLKKGF